MSPVLTNLEKCHQLQSCRDWLTNCLQITLFSHEVRYLCSTCLAAASFHSAIAASYVLPGRRRDLYPCEWTSEGTGWHRSVVLQEWSNQTCVIKITKTLKLNAICTQSAWRQTHTQMERERDPDKVKANQFHLFTCANINKQMPYRTALVDFLVTFRPNGLFWKVTL